MTHDNSVNINESSCLTGEHEYYFTIFIPTYNRAWSLGETFESIEKLAFHDFEVLIVDDGSTDGTRELVESWRSKVPFPVKYVFKMNGGKCSAHNTALAYARGFLFLNLDADDLILPDALQQIKYHWESIPEETRENFAGICGLMNKSDGSISGAPFDEDVIDSDFNEIYLRSTMKKEKKWALKLSVLREYPYPTFEGEKYLRPTLILRRLSHRYKIRFINVPLQVGKYRADGISNNIFWHHNKSPKGQRLFYLEEITQNNHFHKLKKLYNLHVHYVRFSLHSGVGIRSQSKEVKNLFIWILSIPRGSLRWIEDRFRNKVSRQQCIN